MLQNYILTTSPAIAIYGDIAQGAGPTRFTRIKNTRIKKCGTAARRIGKIAYLCANMEQKKPTIPADNDELTARLRDSSTCREAFTEVIRRYSEPLYWQIRRMVQDHDDANDLLQNTFLKAWQSITAFRGDARLSTWLYKIAINESLSFIEQRKRHNNVSLDDDESAVLNTLSADDWVDGDELRRELRQVVASLPEKQQLVFNMKYFDEMKYEDMSQILGTSVGALKASYHLAVKKIEKHFSEME